MSRKKDFSLWEPLLWLSLAAAFLIVWTNWANTSQAQRTATRTALAPTATPSPTSTPTPIYATITGDAIPRSGPGPEYEALPALPTGMTLAATMISTDGAWVALGLSDGRVIWLERGAVDLGKGVLPTATPITTPPYGDTDE